MGYTRKNRIDAVRSRKEQEDDALDLKEKGYPYAAIGSMLGVSGSTAKGYARDAEIRRLKQDSAGEKSQEKVIPFRKRA